MPTTSPRKSASRKKLEPLETSVGGGGAGLSKSMNSTSNKKELVEAVRRLNPASCNTAPVIFWDVEGSLKSVNTDDSGVKQQVAIVENGVNYSIKRYNDLRVINDRLTRDLKARLDELDNQKQAYEDLFAMQHATTAEGIRIEQLKAETEEVKREIEKRAHNTRQLEHMLLRLKQNQLKFDAHMTGMEETMRNISKEGMEIRLLRRGLDAGLAKAVHVLEETQTFLQLSRTDREVLLAQRKNELKTAHTLQEWMAGRERDKEKLATELRGDLTRDEELFLKSQLSDKMEKTKHLQKVTAESHKKLEAMEDAFAQLKQVTGVSSLDEMHEKFSNQKTNKKALEADVKEAEKRLATAKKSLGKLEQSLQEIKSSGEGGGGEQTREYYERFEEEILASKNEQKSIKADMERLSAVLLSLHQGGQGLLQRINPFMHLAEGGFDIATDSTTSKQPWHAAVDALSVAEQVLFKLMENMAGDGTSPSNMKLLSHEEDEDEDSDAKSEAVSVSSMVEAPAMANNVRIKSRKLLRELEAVRSGGAAMNGFGGGGGGMGGGGQSAPARLAGEGGGNGAGGEDEGGAGGGGGFITGLLLGDDEGGGGGGGGGGGREGGGIGGGGGGGESSIHEEPPSRLAVKNNSKSDRMFTTSAGTGDDAGLALEARLKAQKAMANRLSTFPAPATLPEGITLRDDPMTKTNAFLTKMPKLT